MKKDFESRFLPNVKFFIPDNLQDLWDKLCSEKRDVYDFTISCQFGAIDETGNNIGFITNNYTEWLKVQLSIVSVYEAIPELVSDGMRYNKELDKLVPDIIENKKSLADEYVVGIDLKNHRAYNIGSSNYSSMNIQPWDIWKDWKLDPWDADIVKRISRTKDIPGKTFEEARIEDYEKIKHVCDEKISQLKEEKNVK